MRPPCYAYPRPRPARGGRGTPTARGPEATRVVQASKHRSDAGFKPSVTSLCLRLCTLVKLRAASGPAISYCMSRAGPRRGRVITRGVDFLPVYLEHAHMHSTHTRAPAPRARWRAHDTQPLSAEPFPNFSCPRMGGAKQRAHALVPGASGPEGLTRAAPRSRAPHRPPPTPLERRPWAARGEQVQQGVSAASR